MKNKNVRIPTIRQIEDERRRIRRSRYYVRALRNTVSALVVVAAVAVLITTLFLPILQISGDSMSPTLAHDEIVLLVKTDSIDRGDLIAFYYQGKILIKRVVALAGEEVSISAEGDVFVDGQLLEEPYVTEKSLGDCDLEFPYQVPGDSVFVLGDRRSHSVDSRNSVIGTVSGEDRIGKVVFRVWPLNRLGPVR